MGEPELKAPLERIYEAGKDILPEAATMVAGCAGEIAAALEVYQGQLAATGRAQPLVDAVAINRECYDLLRRAVIFMENGAEGLVAAADDYVRTDASSAERTAEVRRRMAEPTPNVPIPPKLPEPGA